MDWNVPLCTDSAFSSDFPQRTARMICQGQVSIIRERKYQLYIAIYINTYVYLLLLLSFSPPNLQSQGKQSEILHNSTHKFSITRAVRRCWLKYFRKRTATFWNENTSLVEISIWTGNVCFLMKNKSFHFTKRFCFFYFKWTVLILCNKLQALKQKKALFKF